MSVWTKAGGGEHGPLAGPGEPGADESPLRRAPGMWVGGRWGRLRRVHTAPFMSLGDVGCQPQEEGQLESSVSHLCLGGQVGGVRAGRCSVTGGAGLGPGGPESADERLWHRVGPVSQAAERGFPGGPTLSGLLGFNLWGGARAAGIGTWALSPLSWAGGRSLGPEGAVGMGSAGG